MLRDILPLADGSALHAETGRSVAASAARLLVAARQHLAQQWLPGTRCLMFRSAVVLFSISLLFGTNMGMAQQGPMVHFKLINNAGIRSMPARDAAMRSMLGSSLQEIQASGLEPYAIAVFNDTDKTIISSVLRTTVVDQSGKTRTRETLFNNLRLRPNGGVIPNGMEVAAKSSRVLAPGKSYADSDRPPSGVATSSSGSQYTAIGGSSPLAMSKAQEELAQQQSVVVSLDLVVYEDGRVVGPDEGRLLHNIRTQLQVERDLALSVKQSLASNKDFAVVLDLLKRKAETNIRPRMPGDASLDHWLDFFTVLTSKYYLYRASSKQEDLVATIDEVLARPAIKLVPVNP